MHIVLSSALFLSSKIRQMLVRYLEETVEFLGGQDLPIGCKSHVGAVLDNGLACHMDIDVHVCRCMHPRLSGRGSIEHVQVS